MQDLGSVGAGVKHRLQARKQEVLSIKVTISNFEKNLRTFLSICDSSDIADVKFIFVLNMRSALISVLLLTVIIGADAELGSWLKEAGSSLLRSGKTFFKGPKLEFEALISPLYIILLVCV